MALTYYLLELEKCLLGESFTLTKLHSMCSKIRWILSDPIAMDLADEETVRSNIDNVMNIFFMPLLYSFYKQVKNHKDFLLGKEEKMLVVLLFQAPLFNEPTNEIKSYTDQLNIFIVTIYHFIRLRMCIFEHLIDYQKSVSYMFFSDDSENHEFTNFVTAYLDSDFYSSKVHNFLSRKIYDDVKHMGKYNIKPKTKEDENLLNLFFTSNKCRVCNENAKNVLVYLSTGKKHPNTASLNREKNPENAICQHEHNMKRIKSLNDATEEKRDVSAKLLVDYLQVELKKDKNFIGTAQYYINIFLYFNSCLDPTSPVWQNSLSVLC